MISTEYAAQVEPPFQCARVIAQDKNSFLVSTNTQAELRAQIRGSLRHDISSAADFPVVGDFVAVTDSQGSVLIERVLPRKNLFARRAVWGSHDIQPIAANLDTLFICTAMNRDFNLRRIERYAIAAAAYEVPFAVLLTKADLIEDSSIFIESVRALLNNVPVIAISANDDAGLAQLESFRGEGKTIAFAGSSGVGKSTLINLLAQSTQLPVSEAREDDDRGRHTSTRRFLLHLEDGTAIIDTPGMREFALADADEGVSSTFADILGMSQNCRFRDCTHSSEPNCAVRESLDEARLASWRKLEKEAAFEARKNDPRAREAERAKWRPIHKANRLRKR